MTHVHAVAEKEALAGKENLNAFIRYQYLQSIDRKWLAHLERLESLRESVYLRSYGQKNPLTEYKLEGFDIFYTMLDDIRLEIASRIFLVKIKRESSESVRRERRISGMNENHQDSGMFGIPRSGIPSGKGGSPTQSAANPSSVQVVRTGPKRRFPYPVGGESIFCTGGKDRTKNRTQ